MEQYKNKVISPNYKDRKSEFKWLVRSENESPENAKAFKAIIATSVEFVNSNQYEKGFGCARVGLSKKVQSLNELSHGLRKESFIRLQFDGFYFFIIQKGVGKLIKEVHTLYLDEYGHMWAHTIVPEPVMV